MSDARPDAHAAVTVLLAEYDKLKAEQTSRIGFRDNLIYAVLGATAAVGYAAFQYRVVQWVLLIPLACFVLGWTYPRNDQMITQLGRYVRDTLAPQLTALSRHRDVLGWENEHPADRRRVQRKWIQLTVDLAAFCLPSAAVIGLLVRSGTTLGYHYGRWTWSMVGVAALATALLTWQFVVYSEIKPPRVGRRRLTPEPPVAAGPDR
jgi:hypothetical protein